MSRCTQCTGHATSFKRLSYRRGAAQRAISTYQYRQMSYKCSTNCILKRADQVIQGPRKWCDSIQLIIGHFPSLDCSNKSLFCPISNMLPLTNLQCTPLPVTLRSSPSFNATVDGDFLHHLHEVSYTHFRHEISQI